MSRLLVVSSDFHAGLPPERYAECFHRSCAVGASVMDRREALERDAIGPESARFAEAS